MKECRFSGSEWRHWTALTAGRLSRYLEEKTTRSNRMNFRLNRPRVAMTYPCLDTICARKCTAVEEIARDVQWRKPSSKENIVRSSYWWFLFKMRWVRNSSNSFWKENCWYRPKASPEIVIISYMNRHYRPVGGGGWGTAIYGLYRYVSLWRVWFSSSSL